MKAKIQHWVPQLYLRNFATPETKELETGRQKIFAQNWENDNKCFHTNIKNVSAKSYLYTPVDEETGKRNWDIDDRFQRYENLIGRIWPYFLNLDLAFFGESKLGRYNIPQGETLRKAISVFIVQLFIRNPFNKKKIREVVRSQIEELNKLPKDKAGIPRVTHVELGSGHFVEIDPSDWHEFRDFDERLVENIFLETLGEGQKELLELIYNKKWRVIVSQKKYFITCDRPIIVVDPSVGLAGSDIYFPLSPQRCLMLSNEAEEEGYFHAVEEIVPLVNLLAIRNAGLQTYSHRDQIDVMKDAVNYHENILSH